MIAPRFTAGHFTGEIKTVDTRHDTVTLTDDRAPEISVSFSPDDLRSIANVLRELHRRIQGDAALHFSTDAQRAAA